MFLALYLFFYQTIIPKNAPRSKTDCQKNPGLVISHRRKKSTNQETMKYSLKKLPKSTVELDVELTFEEVEHHKKKACEEISHEVKIDGFRPGHIPMEVLEKHIDKKHIMAHTYELAIQMSYAEIVVKEKLQVVARPEIKLGEPKADEPFKFKAIVAVMPEVKVKDHKTIKIPKEEVKVLEKELEETLGDMQKYFTEWKDVEREIKKGDRVEVDASEGIIKKASSIHINL